MKVVLRPKQVVPVYQQFSFLYIPAAFLVTAVFLDVIMYAEMGLPFASHYLISFTLMLMLAGLICLVRRHWVQTILCSLLLGCQLFTCISNIIGYQTCMEIFSLETIKTLYTAFNNASSVDLNVWFMVPISGVLCFYIVIVVFVLGWCRVAPQAIPQRWQTMLCGLLVWVSFCSYTFAYSGLEGYQKTTVAYADNLSSAQFNYDTFASRLNTFKMFGSYSYYLDNLLSLNGAKTSVNKVLDNQLQTQFVPDSFIYPQAMYDGYNLIMVLMETFEAAAINPYTMPRLYNFMQQNCIWVNGYYSIERTCFTDYIAQTGMNVLGQELWSNYGNVKIPFSLANIFRDNGYTANMFHDSNSATYNRRQVFTQALGFENFYDYTSYDSRKDENLDYNVHCACDSDELLFSENLHRIAPADKKFFSYLLSVSTHAISSNIDLEPYHQAGFKRIQKYYDQLAVLYPNLTSDDPNERQLIKNYLAGTYSFDLGFGALLDYLKITDDISFYETTGMKRKLIETTGIMLFGDHYYYINPTVVKAENDNPRDLVGNRCPLIIYNPRRTVNQVTCATNALVSNPQKLGEPINRFTSTMDLYKTACSLFNIATDQQLTYGHSVFDPDSMDASLGIGYMNGYLWGSTGYDHTTDQFELWRTSDFVNYTGKQLTATEFENVKPVVARTLASIQMNMALYKTDGFQNLEKLQEKQRFRFFVMELA